MMETCWIAFTRGGGIRVAVLGGMILSSGIGCAGCSKDSVPQPAEGVAKPPGSRDEFYDHKQFEIKVREQSVGTFERYNRLFNYDKVTLPGEKPLQTAVLWNKISPDGADWAIVHADGAIINGKNVTLPEPPQTPFAFQFLAGGRWVYVGDRCVVDGTERGPKFDAINGWGVQPDSPSVAYVAKQGTETLIVHDGRRQPAIGTIDVRSLRLSPDGKRSAYVAEREGRDIAVVDGKEVAFEGKKIFSRQIFFSPDGKRFAFIATDDATCTAVVDGRQDTPFTKIVPLFFSFSPDGRQYAYVATGNGPPKVVLNGREVAVCLPVPVFTFSPDGRHFAYVDSASDPGSECVVIDGKRGPAYKSVVRRVPYETLDEGNQYRQQVFTSLVFSPDSKRHAYCVKKDGGEAVVIDGQVGPVYDQVAWGLHRFSGDSQRFIYTAIRGGKGFVVNDGRELGPYLELDETNFVVSHNGEHTAFAVFEPDPKEPKARQQRVVVDGVAGPTFKFIVDNSLMLSPCGKLHAYVAQPLGDDINLAIIVDGKEVGRIESPAAFDAIGKMYDELNEHRPLEPTVQEPGIRFPVYDKSGIAQYEELPGRWRTRPAPEIKRPEPYHFSLSSYKSVYRSADRKLTVWGFQGFGLMRYDIEIAPQP